MGCSKGRGSLCCFILDQGSQGGDQRALSCSLPLKRFSLVVDSLQMMCGLKSTSGRVSHGVRKGEGGMNEAKGGGRGSKIQSAK